MKQDLVCRFATSAYIPDPIEFGVYANYSCVSGTWFEKNRTQTDYRIKCLVNGTFAVPVDAYGKKWDNCVASECGIEYNLSFYALLHPEMALPLVGDAAHIAHKDRRNEGRMMEELSVFLHLIYIAYIH